MAKFLKDSRTENLKSSKKTNSKQNIGQKLTVEAVSQKTVSAVSLKNSHIVSSSMSERVGRRARTRSQQSICSEVPQTSEKKGGTATATKVLAASINRYMGLTIYNTKGANLSG